MLVLDQLGEEFFPVGQEIADGEGGVGRDGVNEGGRKEGPDELPLVLPSSSGEPGLYVCSHVGVPDLEGKVTQSGKGGAVGEAGEGVHGVGTVAKQTGMLVHGEEGFVLR